MNESTKTGRMKWFFTGVAMIAIAIIIFFLTGYQTTAIALIFNVVFAGIPIYLALTYKTRNGEAKTAAKIAMVILAGVAIAFNYGVLRSTRPVELVWNDDTIEIKSIYGIDLDIAKIKGIAIINEAPVVGSKLRGFAMAGHKRGKFGLPGGGPAYLYIDTRHSSFLRIDSDLGVVYLDYDPLNETQRKLTAQWALGAGH